MIFKIKNPGGEARDGIRVHLPLLSPYEMGGHQDNLECNF
jgi:hypothetical protein